MTDCAVIIPAYNAAAYLEQAIASALGQTTPVTLLVVDDGSTDATPEICAKYGSALRLLRQSNQGVSVARNAGAAASEAEWLLFLDADDRLLRDAVERLLLRARESSSGVCYGQTVYFDEVTGARRTHGHGASEGPPPAGAHGSFWKSAITTPGAALIRRSLFAEVGGFDPAVNSLADRDFWLKAGVLAPFAFVNAPVIEKREHGDNMSGNLNRALFQAAVVQLGFLDWCAARQIDTSFLETNPPAIIDNVLRKSFETRSLGAIRDLLTLAEQQNLSTPLLPEARRYVSLTPTAADLRLRLRAARQRISRLFGKGDQ